MIMASSTSGGASNISTRVMLKVLSNANEGLKICYFNARSFNTSKLDFMRHVIDNSIVDIICVAESWFQLDTPDSCYEITGYNLYRNDRRTDTVGGGIAIYCRVGLDCRVVKKSDEEGIEYLILELSEGATKCIVSCIYS